MPQRRPPKAELADIAEHIVAGGHGAVLDPGDQIVEGSLAIPGISSLLSLEGRGGRRCFDRERLVIKPTPAVRFGCVLAHGESRFRRDKTPSPKVDFAAEILSLDLIA